MLMRLNKWSVSWQDVVSIKIEKYCIFIIFYCIIDYNTIMFYCIGILRKMLSMENKWRKIDSTNQNVVNSL